MCFVLTVLIICALLLAGMGLSKALLIIGIAGIVVFALVVTLYAALVQAINHYLL